MGLLYKTLESCSRAMYLYFPPIPKHSPYKRCSVTVLLDEADEEKIKGILKKSGLDKLAQEKQLVLSFPEPGTDGWDYDKDLDIIDPVSYTHLDVYKRQKSGLLLIRIRLVRRMTLLP